jgi:TRAP-type C4-dicarboxylate transport system permease small subunit
MRGFQTAAFGLSRIAAGLACLVVILMVLLILYEIVLRTFFASSTYVLDEFAGYGVAAVTFLALGYSFEHGSMIRVGLLVGRLTGKARRALEVFCALATLWVTSLLVWYLGLAVRRSWTRGEVGNSIAEVPQWIPEGLVLLGLGVFWLQLFAYLIRQITGEPPPVIADPAIDAQHDL